VYSMNGGFSIPPYLLDLSFYYSFKNFPNYSPIIPKMFPIFLVQFWKIDRQT